MTPDLPPLREIIAKYDLGAKKSLGQHFLLDLNVTRKIVREAGVKPGDNVLEIGPGPGGLTRSLLEVGANVTAIEKDARCIDALTELHSPYGEMLSLISTDAVAANENEFLLGNLPVKIIANLPYNIASELLIKWLRAGPSLWTSMTLMFQKEMADRIVAVPRTKSYGRLSIIAQAGSRPTKAFDLPAKAFTPPPKVDSSIVTFDPAKPDFSNYSALESITRAAFSKRRKMLRTSLKPVFGSDVENVLVQVGAKTTQRAEELSVEQYKSLAEIKSISD